VIENRKKERKKGRREGEAPSCLELRSSLWRGLTIVMLFSASDSIANNSKANTTQ